MVVEALVLVGPVVVEAGAEIVKTQFFTFAIFFHRPNISFLFSLLLYCCSLMGRAESRCCVHWISTLVCVPSSARLELLLLLCAAVLLLLPPPSPLMVVRLLLVLVVQ